MPVFTAIATSLLAGTALAGSTFAIGATAFGLQMAAGIGLNYIAASIAGKPEQPAGPGFSVQGRLQAGGTVPRSFVLGYGVTAGSLVYANTWTDGDTPNAYITQVIALSDIPLAGLAETWVNGALCHLDYDAPTVDRGYPVIEYRQNGRDYLWVHFYDGTQTDADTMLVEAVSTDERPYDTTRVGHGVAYAICTALVNDTLFTGFPSY
jgi:hypothetical protein